MKHTTRYPFVMVRTPEGALERHHEDRFFDDLTRDPARRKPWRSYKEDAVDDADIRLD